MSIKSKLRAWRPIAATWVGLYGIYLLFAATLTQPELLAAVACAMIATIAATAFGAVAGVRIRPTFREVVQAWRLPWDELRGMLVVLRALGRQLFTRQGAPSLLRAVPFDVGDDDAHSAARRTLAVLYPTLTPDVIVLGVAHKQALLLYHLVSPQPVPAMVTHLGAHP